MPKAVHLEAARLLRANAVEMERSFTVCGQWDGSDPDAEAEYRHLLRVADALERDADILVEPAFCGHVLDGPLDDGRFVCTRCNRVGDRVDGMIHWRGEVVRG